MKETTIDIPSGRNSRSPAYPAFPLETAIEQARKLWQSLRKQDGHYDSALKVLGYTSRSGPALRALAALSHFGLTVETGKADDRKVRLSEDAQDILHLSDNDPKRQKALKEAALKPPIYAALWERYRGNPPDDSAIRPFLVRDKSYNEEIVSKLLDSYRATLQFAKLDKIGEDGSNEENSSTREQSEEQPPNRHTAKEKVMTFDQELPILVGANKIARIPFPMTEDDFTLLIGTLNLWKNKLLSGSKDPDAEVKTNSNTLED